MRRVLEYRSSLLVWGTKHGGNFPMCFTLERKNSGYGWKFRKDDRYSIVRPTSSVILHANVVLDVNRGQRFPFFLVRKSSDGKQLLQLRRLDPYGHLLRDEYECLVKVGGTDEMCVCSGPSIVAHWSHSDQLLVMFPRKEEACLQLELRGRDIIERASELCRLVTDKVWVFEWQTPISTTPDCPVLVRLLVLSRCVREDAMGDSTMSAFFGCCFISRTQENVSHARTAMRHFFPPEYASVATCITLHWRMEVCPTTGSLYKRPVFVLGTSYRQVLTYEEGCMLHCVTMPTSPCSLRVLQPPIGDPVIVCVDEEKGVYLFKTGELVSHWEGVKLLAVSDFLAKGHKQLLVCHDTDLEDFRITNLCDIDFRSDNQEGTSVEACPDSLLSALKALEIRKHQGELQLESARRDLHQKQELVQRGLVILNSITEQPMPGNEKNSSSSLDSSLVCLLTGNLEPQDHSVEQECALEHGAVRVLSWWQRVLPDGQLWVVALLVKNDSCSMMKHLTLSSVGLNQPTTHSRPVQGTHSHSRIVWIEGRPCLAASRPPPFKRVRKASADILPATDDDLISPRAATCVVLSMEIPDFTAKSLVEFAVVATWEWEQVTGIKTAEIFRTTLDVRDLFSEQFQCSYRSLNTWKGEKRLSSLVALDPPVPVSDQDLVCVLGSMQLAKLQVQSSHVHLSRLPAIIRSILPASVLVLGKDGMLLPATTTSRPTTSIGESHGASVLKGNVLHCLVCNGHQAVLSMLYHSDSQLSIVLQLLKSTIPESITIITS